jgi:hypothetical protein
MPIRIGDGIMRLEIDGKVVATATERPGGWWEVTYWPRFFDRNQAITALTITELLESGRDSNDPVMTALRQELPNGPADQVHHHARRGQGPRQHRP